MDTNLKNNTHIKNKLDNIIKDRKTRLIEKEEFKDAFNYVDELFPNSGVFSAIVYVSPRDTLERNGYKGIGGFYSRGERIIVVSDDFNFKPKNNIWSSIVAKITLDEVIVHELLHYISHKYKDSILSVEAEEEFAYGNSVGYLTSKGYDSDHIVKNIFMPFLISTVNINKLFYDKAIAKGFSKVSIKKDFNKIFKIFEKDIFDESYSISYSKGIDIYNIYSNKNKKIKIKNVDVNIDI
jgi:hypothetical protein